MLRKNLSILSLLSLTFVSVSIFAMTPKAKKRITTNGINPLLYSRYLQYHKMFPGLVPTLPLPFQIQKRKYSQSSKKRNFMNNQWPYKKTLKKVGRVGLKVCGYSVIALGSVVICSIIYLDRLERREINKYLENIKIKKLRRKKLKEEE